MSDSQPIPFERAALHVQDVAEADRYEARLGEDPRLAAVLTYRRMERAIALLHTEVQEGFEGQGVGSRLASWVFDDARRRRLKVLPKCPFIVRWLERHPEQHDILLRPVDGGASRPGSPLDPA